MMNTLNIPLRPYTPPQHIQSWANRLTGKAQQASQPFFGEIAPAKTDYYLKDYHQRLPGIINPNDQRTFQYGLRDFYYWPHVIEHGQLITQGQGSLDPVTGYCSAPYALYKAKFAGYVKDFYFIFQNGALLICNPSDQLYLEHPGRLRVYGYATSQDSYPLPFYDDLNDGSPEAYYLKLFSQWRHDLFCNPLSSFLFANSDNFYYNEALEKHIVKNLPHRFWWEFFKKITPQFTLSKSYAEEKFKNSFFYLDVNLSEISLSHMFGDFKKEPCHVSLLNLQSRDLSYMDDFAYPYIYKGRAKPQKFTIDAQTLKKLEFSPI